MKGAVVIMTKTLFVYLLNKLNDYLEEHPEVVRKAVEDYYNEMNFVNFRDVAVGDCAVFKAKED